MKWKQHKRSRSPIGLDLGDCFIKAAQLDTADPPQLCAAIAMQRSQPGQPFDLAEAQRMRAALERQGFTGRQVVLGIPGKHALSSVLTLPPRTEGVPLDDIARAEMAHEHRCEPDSMEMAYWNLPRPARGSTGTHVMAVACAHEAADAMVRVLLQAGFDVIALDVEGWAIARACHTVMDTTSGIVAAVDIGWDSTTQVLLHEGTVVYERSTFGAGIRQLRQTIEREQQFPMQVIDYLLCDIGFELDMRGQADDWKLLLKANSYLESHFSHIVRELNLSMDYAHSQYPQSPVQQVLILGGGGGVPGLAGYLTHLLETPVMAVRPSDVIGGADKFPDVAQLPSLMIAIGLAQQGGASNAAQKEAA